MSQFKGYPELQELLKDGKVVPFRELPETHQKALIWYMSVDGAAWAVGHVEFSDWPWGEGAPGNVNGRQHVHADIEKFLPRFVEHFGDELFGMAEVDCLALGKIVEKYSPFVQEGAFSSYDPEPSEEDKGEEPPTWPVILVDYDEIIQDGWTRFGTRLLLKIKTTPVVWYN